MLVVIMSLGWQMTHLKPFFAGCHKQFSCNIGILHKDILQVPNLAERSARQKLLFAFILHKGVYSEHVYAHHKPGMLLTHLNENVSNLYSWRYK